MFQRRVNGRNQIVAMLANKLLLAQSAINVRNKVISENHKKFVGPYSFQYIGTRIAMKIA